MGETSLKVSNRMEQHKKTICDEKWDFTEISSHMVLWCGILLEKFNNFESGRTQIWLKATRSSADPTPGHDAT